MKLREAAEISIEALEDILSAQSRGFGIDYVEGYAQTTLRQLRQALSERHECETCAAKRKRLIEAGLLKSPMREKGDEPEAKSTFKFTRFVDGKEMAEGVVIEREATLDAAMKKAVSLCPQRRNTVLVYVPPTDVVEPVAWMHVQGNYEEPNLHELDEEFIERGWEQYPLYSAPKREWQGLTDEEILEAAIPDGADTWVFEIAYAIEAKLKERNNG